MHWADVESSRLAPNSLIATGITPSGPIHLGSLREILTGDAIRRASEGSELVYIADSIDPLRKVYPFLPDSYELYVGMPLSEIPCPCGEHKSYSDHYLEPFLRTIDELGIKCSIKYTHNMYKEGEYTEAIRKLVGEREKVAEILSEKTERQLPDGWYPYNPRCSSCGKIGDAKIKSFDDPIFEYTCGCGHHGSADIRTDDGKLPWRCDWPARWWMLGVDCEPFGKDHAASGGSWDTGKAIIEEVFECEAPHPVVYEWIQLKGHGPMSSSTGVAIKGEDMLKMVEPEVVRFLLMKTKPQTHVDFDPGLGILDLVDEYDSVEERYFEGELDEDTERIYELSQTGGILDSKTFHIPYRHLVNLVQIYDDFEQIWRIAGGEGVGGMDFEMMKERADRVRYWLDNFAPSFVKFSIKKEPPEIDLGQKEEEFLKEFLFWLESLEEWNAKKIHNKVHEIAESMELSKGKAFGLFYRILLDQKRGPKLGRFLMQLDREFVLQRIREELER